jgi:hypothetical protein
MDRGSFEIIDEDPSLDTVKVIEDWVDKWRPQGLSDKWIKFLISTTDVHPGINYPLIKTHKPNNPARVTVYNFRLWDSYGKSVSFCREIL